MNSPRRLPRAPCSNDGVNLVDEQHGPLAEPGQPERLGNRLLRLADVGREYLGRVEREKVRLGCRRRDPHQPGLPASGWSVEEDALGAGYTEPRKDFRVRQRPLDGPLQGRLDRVETTDGIPREVAGVVGGRGGQGKLLGQGEAGAGAGLDGEDDSGSQRS